MSGAPTALAAGGLTDFKETDSVHVDKAAGTVTVGNTHGDHFAVYEGQEQKTNDFVLEADVELVSGGYDGNKESRCAGLIFGVASKNMPGRQWRCVNIDAGRTVNDDGSVRGDGFRAFGPGIVETTTGGELAGIDVSKALHFKLDMKASGEFTYTFGNTGGDMRTITASVDSWTGGYVGIMSFCTEAKFSNIQFEDRTDHSAADVSASKVAASDAYTSSLGDLTTHGGTWEIRDNGLYSNAVDQGNSWAFSQKTGRNFAFSTDVTFLQDAGAATLLFHSASAESWNDCYAVNLDGTSHAGKMWRQEEGVDLQLIDAKEMPEAEKYTLTVIAIDSWMQFYVNGELVGATADYTLSPGNKGQNDHYKEGYFGLLNWNGEMVFQNTKYTEITDSFTPLVKDITVTSSVGNVEAKAQFREKEPITIQYVGNDAATVNINVTPVNSSAKITVQGPDGKTYAAFHVLTRKIYRVNLEIPHKFHKTHIVFPNFRRIIKPSQTKGSMKK